MNTSPKVRQQGRLTLSQRFGYFLLGLLIAVAFSFILLRGVIWTFP